MPTETGSASHHNLLVDDEPVSPPQEQNRQAAAATISIDDIVAGINSGDPNKEVTATRAARKILSKETSLEKRINILINTNVVPKLVEFLNCPTK
jgi:importin subunit alpha-1/8